jgi:hypothetical protein
VGEVDNYRVVGKEVGCMSCESVCTGVEDGRVMVGSGGMTGGSMCTSSCLGGRGDGCEEGWWSDVGCCIGTSAGTRHLGQ